MVEVQGAGRGVAGGVVGQGGDGEDEGRVGEGPGEEEQHAGGGEGLCGDEGRVRGFEVVDADRGDGVLVGGGVGDEAGGGVVGEGPGHGWMFGLVWFGEKNRGEGGECGGNWSGTWWKGG